MSEIVNATAVFKDIRETVIMQIELDSERELQQLGNGYVYNIQFVTADYITIDRSCKVYFYCYRVLCL